MSSIPEPIPLQAAQSHTFYDPNAVALATLFGGPVAGSFLMALNYRQLQMTGKAVVALIVGILVTGMAIMVGWNLPKSVTFPMALALLVATKWIAQSLLGATVKYHVDHGGRLGSRWTALASGVGFMIILFTIAFFSVSKSTFATTKTGVMFGSKDEVYYSGSATREEAQALGNVLKSSGYFQDRGADVFLSKGKDGAIVSFVVSQKFLSQAGILDTFEEAGRQVAPAIGGFPVHVQLVNPAREVQQESLVGKVEFPGNDSVYYLGSANQSEAQALGQKLQAAGFFHGEGADVFLSRHKDGTALSFVVSEGAWDRPAIVDNFRTITRGVAPVVGGLPIRFRLINTSLEIKKDQIVQ